MTAKELAKILGISEASVSYALNGKPGVSQATRMLVRDAAEKYGLQFKALDYGAIFSNRLYFILFKRADIRYVGNTYDNYFYVTLELAITEMAHQYGYKCNRMTIYSAEELNSELHAISNLDCAGIIILATEMMDTDYIPLSFSPVPVILLDNHFRSTRFSSIYINNFDSAFKITDYLCKKYHSAPGLIIPNKKIVNFTEREEGFFSALHTNGFSTHTVKKIDISTDLIKGMPQDLDIAVNNGPLARCYFAVNDHIANAFIESCSKKGIRIPEDVAVAGFDDMPFSSSSPIGITTMHVPITYMGHQAIRTLCEYNQHKEKMTYTSSIKVGTTLLVRKSA